MKAIAFLVLTCFALAYAQQDPVCLATRLQSLTACAASLAADPSSFCTNSCVDDLRVAYTDCGYTGTSNPVDIACPSTGGPSTGGGGQDPVCLAGRLQSLTACAASLASNPTGFCTNSCVDDLRAAYTDCGYTGTSNPIVVACGTVEDPVCLAGRLQSLTACAASLVADPSSLCINSCVDDLRAAYTDCGYTGTSNPVDAACPSTGGPSTSSPDPICLSQRLQPLTACASQLAADPSNFCTISCVDDLRAAYSDCGYTGTSNPIDVACGSGETTTNSGSRQDPECLSRMILPFASCATSLETNSCSDSCVPGLAGVFENCGYTGSNNPVLFICPNVTPSGGAPPIVAGPVVVVTAILLALAALFY